MISLQPNPLEFLLQLDIVDELPAIGKEAWQTLYLRANSSPHRLGMWCALLDADAANRAMDHDSWDLHIGDSGPGFGQNSADGREVTTYHRFGRPDGVRPLLLYRSFHDAFPEYIEVAEEFRLYHGLAENKADGCLFSFDASGRKIEVIRFMPNHVQANLKYLRQFQAGTGLHLGIYVDSVRYSPIALTSIPPDKHKHTEANGAIRWQRTVAKCDFQPAHKTFSRLLCKVILAPPSQTKAGIWPFESGDDHRTVPFIIGIDKNGNAIEHTGLLPVSKTPS